MASGRPTQAVPYVSTVAYHAGGQLAQLQYANGGQTDIASMRASGSPHSRTGGWPSSATNTIPSEMCSASPIPPIRSRIAASTYDALDRLKNAQGRWAASSTTVSNSRVSANAAPEDLPGARPDRYPGSRPARRPRSNQPEPGHTGPYRRTGHSAGWQTPPRSPGVPVRRTVPVGLLARPLGSRSSRSQCYKRPTSANL